MIKGVELKSESHLIMLTEVLREGCLKTLMRSEPITERGLWGVMRYELLINEPMLNLTWKRG